MEAQGLALKGRLPDKLCIGQRPSVPSESVTALSQREMRVILTATLQIGETEAWHFFLFFFRGQVLKKQLFIIGFSSIISSPAASYRGRK